MLQFILNYTQVYWGVILKFIQADSEVHTGETKIYKAATMFVQRDIIRQVDTEACIGNYTG